MPTAIYVRKSTESEDRQVQSLDDQLAALNAIAARENLAVDEVFVESKSAKEPHARPEFQRLLAKVDRGEIDGILTWKIDRLSRNMVDGGFIAHYLQTGRLQFIRTVDRTYRPEDNALLLSIENGMATSYLQDLSRNVKRGMQGKAERGWMPGRAPIGYLNNLITHEIETDPERFDLVKLGWHLLLHERLNPAEISRQLISLGLTSNRRRNLGGSISPSLLYDVFSNPFYTGRFIRNGVPYEGKHQPMISGAEFELAQALLQKTPDRRLRGKDHAYAGVLKCGHCGCSVVGETKIRRNSSGKESIYIYYHCSGVKGCRRLSVTESVITKQALNTLSRIAIPPAIARKLETLLEESIEKVRAASSKASESFTRRLAEDRRRLAGAQHMRLDGELTAGEYVELKNTLNKSIFELEARISAQNQESTRMVRLITQNLAEAERAHGYNKFSKLVLRSYLQRLGEQHTLTDKVIRFDLHPILELIAGLERPLRSSQSIETTGIEPQNSIWRGVADQIQKIAIEQIRLEDAESCSEKELGERVPPERGRPQKRHRLQPDAEIGRLRARRDLLAFERRRLG